MKAYLCRHHSLQNCPRPSCYSLVRPHQTLCYYILWTGSDAFLNSAYHARRICNWICCRAWRADIHCHPTDKVYHQPCARGGYESLVRIINEKIQGGSVSVWLIKRFSYDQLPSCDLQMLENFRENVYKCPTDSLNCGFQPAFSTNLTSSTWNKPQKGLWISIDSWRDFVALAKIGVNGSHSKAKFSPPLTELRIIPWREMLAEVKHTTSNGFSVNISKERDAWSCRLLQTPSIAFSSLSQIDIRRMPHDFFTPQPVKGKERNP